MAISKEISDRLNELLQGLFAANAQSDNIAYNLSYNYFEKISQVYHQCWAHAFPSDDFADGLSNEMLELGVRPVRKGLPDFSKEYGKDLKALFVDNKQMVDSLQILVKDTIDAAEMDGDVEIKVFLENLLEGKLKKFVKQANEWVEAASSLTAHELNIHFCEYTNFIDISRIKPSR